MSIDSDLIAAGAAFQRNKQIEAQQELLRIAKDARFEKTRNETDEYLDKIKKEEKG